MDKFESYKESMYSENSGHFVGKNVKLLKKSKYNAEMALQFWRALVFEYEADANDGDAPPK